MSKLIVKDLEGPASTSNKIYIASGSQLDIAGSPGGAAAINLAVDGGDITTGTVSNARLAAGTIIQVVTATPLTDSGFSNAQGWNTIGTPGGTGTGTIMGGAVITPSSASNKILVIYSIGGISTYDGNTPTTRIYRAISGGTSSAPLVATGAGNKSAGMTIEPGYAAPGTEKVGSTGMHFLDSPNTTSAITYTIQWYGREDTTGFWNYYNRQEAGNDHAYYGRAVTTLTVIEIKG
jgi:hypothetical protein